MEAKKILKTAGKVALTAVAPPVGIFTFKEVREARKSEKATAGLVTVFISAAINALYLVNSGESIYSDSKAQVWVGCVKDFCSLSKSLPVIISPLYAPFFSEKKSSITTPDKQYVIWQPDAIQFSDGKYHENLRQDAMAYSMKKYQESELFDNIPTLEKKLRKYQKGLEHALQQGDIFGARAAKEKVENYGKELEQARTGYNEVKKALEEVVSKMNAELVQLRDLPEQK